MRGGMVIAWIWVVALLCQARVVAQDSDAFEPIDHPLDRYAVIWERAPFVIETKIVEESAGLAQRFALTGVAMVDGAPVAFLLDRSTLARIIVAPGRTSQGIELLSVDQQSNVRNSSAVIKLGAEQASLRFDTESLQVSNGAAPMPTGATPGTPTAQNSTAAPASQPNINSAQPPTTPTRVIRRTLIRPRE